MPFAEVARAGSDGVEAANGGRRDWTTKGSLVPGTRPGIVRPAHRTTQPHHQRAPTGFHIIRVTEREEAAVTPFLEAQVAIRDKIVQERSDKAIARVLGESASPNAGEDDLRRRVAEVAQPARQLSAAYRRRQLSDRSSL